MDVEREKERLLKMLGDITDRLCEDDLSLKKKRDFEALHEKIENELYRIICEEKTTYEELGIEVGRLVDEKQAAYGDSFGKSGRVLQLLYPDGVTIEQYDDMLAIVRIVDKLFRIATDRDALGETPFRDIAGYALLGTAMVERKPAEGV